jgi:hypothetical protein
MNLGIELAALFRRDLRRLAQEIEHFPDDAALWNTAPGVRNSAGNLALHLEGNLREYIGRQLGGVDYSRNRRQEFSAAGPTRVEMKGRMEALAASIPEVIAGLSGADWENVYPEQVLGLPLSTAQFLIHLHGHFNYHLGQIDYLRRVLTQGGAVDFAPL